MKKEDITGSMDNPSGMEELYRNNPAEFERIFTGVYEENRDSIVLKIWNERLFYKDPQEIKRKNSKSGLNITVMLAVITGLLVIIPQLIPAVDQKWYLSRYTASLALTSISAYFLILHGRSKGVLIFVSASAAIIFLLIGVFPFHGKSQTFVLSCMHVPLVAWSLFAVSFTGKNWKSEKSRIDFLRFNGELIVYTAIILLGGIVLTGITFALFGLIDLKIEKWYMENIVIMGLAAAPVVAAYIIDNSADVKKNIASILARIFMPLFLLTVLTYLAAMIIQHKSPYSDRDFLIVFNGLLLLVLAISLFSIIEKKYQGGSRLFEVTNIALLFTTLVIDLTALSAILFRLRIYGITPNRIAVLGANLLIFVHLFGFLRPFIENLKKKGDYRDIEKWTAAYLPVYSLWSLIVAVGFPVFFRFK